MATVIAKYKQSYSDIRATGANILMVPDGVGSDEMAMLTVMFNIVLMRSPGNIIFEVTEYDDGHKEYLYPPYPEFQIRVSYNK